MVFFNLVGFAISAIVMVKAADFCVSSVSRIQHKIKVSSMVVSFFIVGLVSAFPEGIVSVVSALQGVPMLGFGTLMGSVLADLSLVLGIIGILAGRSRLSEGLKHDVFLLGLLMFPVILAMDGVISRIDGLALVGVCMAFFFMLLKTNHVVRQVTHSHANHLLKHAAIFLGAMAVVFVSATYLVKFSQLLAADLGLPLLVVGLIFLALATSLPELVFGVTAARKKLMDLAIGDILGVMVIDATLLMGIIALINPIVITGVDLGKIGIFVLTFLALASYFLEKERVFTWKEGIIMVMMYIIFLITELSTAAPA